MNSQPTLCVSTEEQNAGRIAAVLVVFIEGPDPTAQPTPQQMLGVLEQAVTAAEKLWPTLEQKAPRAVQGKSLEELKRQLVFIGQMAEARDRAVAFARRVEQRMARAEEALAEVLRDLFSQARPTMEGSAVLQEVAGPLLSGGARQGTVWRFGGRRGCARGWSWTWRRT